MKGEEGQPGEPTPAAQEEPEYGSYAYFLILTNGDRKAAEEAYAEFLQWDVPQPYQ